MCLCNDMSSLQNSERLSLLKAMGKTCFHLAVYTSNILKTYFFYKGNSLLSKTYLCDPNIFSSKQLGWNQRYSVHPDILLNISPVTCGHPEAMGEYHIYAIFIKIPLLEGFLKKYAKKLVNQKWGWKDISNITTKY